MAQTIPQMNSSDIAKFFEQSRIASANPPTTWSPLEAYLRQYRLLEGSSCLTLFEKGENIRRHMRALDSANAEMIRIKDRLEFLDKAILVTTLIRDTSHAFLDMAGAALPGADRVSKPALFAIDGFTSAGELATGQGDAAKIALRTANSVNSVTMPGKYSNVAQYKAQQAINLAQGSKDMADAKDRATRQMQGNKMSINLLADSVKSMADMSIKDAKNVRDTGRVVGGVAVAIKAAYSYRVNVTQAFEQYAKSSEDNAMDRASLLNAHTISMQRLRKSYDESLAALEACRKREGLV